MQYWGNVNDCTVTYNDTIMRRDGTGRGRRRGLGDVWKKKSRDRKWWRRRRVYGWYIILLLLYVRKQTRRA